ncbi:MAG: hypothetical protein IKG72_06885 [Bacillus sp. (in: Bacteria)]|nr:hypothetical protein [Bacillus sp. (in: firmicutes)]
MTSYYYIQNRYQELLSLRQALITQLEKAPPGTLIATLHKGHYQYRKKLNKAKPVYIKKSERDLARKLAAKAVRKQRLKDVNREIKAIEAYLSKYDGESCADHFLETHEGHRILASEWGAIEGRIGVSLLSDTNWINKVKKNPVAYDLLLKQTVKDADGNLTWLFEPAHPTAINQEKRTLKMTNGVFVRTKSEAFFGNEFYKSGLLFVYETQIQANGRIYHPDFVVFHPITGDLVIFEYLGLLPDEFNLLDETKPSHEEDASAQELNRLKIRYRNSNANRIRDYIKEGYLPGRTLIVMSESSDMPLDMQLGSKVVDCYFKE